MSLARPMESNVPIEVVNPVPPLWYFHMDSVTNEQKYKVGLILTTLKLKCLKVEYTLHLSSKSMNNKAKY